MTTFYYPDGEELKRLDQLQLDMRIRMQKLHEKITHLSPGEKYLAKRAFFKTMRYRWMIYPGFKQVEKITYQQN